MDLFQAINERHSYRGGYKNQPVPREDLEKIVDAALKAPTGKNAQTTGFVVIDDAELLKQINELHPLNKAMNQARAYIICIIDRDAEKIYEGYDFQVEDCAAAVENMLLAITALGYASVWVDGWLRVEGRAELLGNMIDLPSEKIARIILPIGVPETPGQQPPKKQLRERAFYNSYNG
jgi:nitroreductase